MHKRILIVDDENNFLAGLSEALYKYCHYQGEITAVTNGIEAIDAIHSSAFDICFLDINLPDINGLEIMKQINKVSPKTKIAFMSGSFITDDMRTDIESGSSIFFSKPIDLDQIRDFIHHMEENERASPLENPAKPRAERRNSPRRLYSQPVNYSLGVFHDALLKFDQTSTIVDISEGGIGMTVDHFIKAGQIIRLDEDMEYKSGLIKWSCKENHLWRAGIKFL